MFPSRLVSVLGKGALENNYSVSFDGSNDYVVISDDNSLDLTGDISISAWVFFSSFDHDQGGIVAKSGNSGDGYGLYSDKGGSTSEGTVKFYSNTYDASVATSGTLNIDTWYHITGVHDSSASTSKIYIDGVLIDTQTSASSSIANSDNLHIGRIFGGSESYNQNGNIDEVAIWDKVLTAGDISALYQARGTSDLNDDGNSANLKGWWRMGDGVLDDFGDSSSGLIGDQVTPTLGSEELTNGDFTDDTSTDSSSSALAGWTNGGTHNSTNKFTISGGACTMISDATSVSMKQTTLVAGKLYKATVNITAVGSGGIKFYIGSSGDADEFTTTGVKTFYGIADNTTFEVWRKSGVTSNVTFDSLTIQLVNGNPGLMTNMDAVDIEKDPP